VLRRHYCHDAHPQLALDRQRQIVLDGEVFVHWHDNLTAQTWEPVMDQEGALPGVKEEVLQGMAGGAGTGERGIVKAEQPQSEKVKTREMQPA
jgi:hypothetical protein